MAKITGFLQKVFGQDASNIGQVGSAALGTKLLTTDPDTIQALTAFENGIDDITISSKRIIPAEEFMALHYLHTLQNAYQQQEGIQEYNADVTYFTNSIVKKSGTYALYGSLVDDNVGNALTDTTKWAFLSNLSEGMITLTTNTTFYVATTGSDTTGNGTSGLPWATIQKAFNELVIRYNMNGYVATIQLADGTYASASMLGQPAGVASGITGVVVRGNSTTPANTVVTALGAAYGGAFTVDYIKLVNGSGSGLSASRNGCIKMGTGVRFGACSIAHILVDNLGILDISAAYTIEGAAAYHYRVLGGRVQSSGAALTVTVSGTPAISTFASASQMGYLFCTGLTFSGSATGTRYLAVENSVIQTNGGGANFFSGSVAGSVATGGQYI